MTFTWEHVLYRLYDQDGGLLYVGITNSIAVRFKTHQSAPARGDRERRLRSRTAAQTSGPFRYSSRRITSSAQ